MTAVLAAIISACALQDDARDEKPVEATDVADTAESLQASPNAVACPKEFFCLYSGKGLGGIQLLKKSGNWTGTVSGVNSVTNHGREQRGVDHVELTWHQGSLCRKRCVHYSPGPGTFQFDLPNVQVTSITWRGECAHGEDVEQACCPGCQ
jgi:hypothetical protein